MEVLEETEFIYAFSKHTLAQDKFRKKVVAQHKLVMEAVIILALVEDTELINAFA